MGIEAKITSKGQATIPIAVREKLGLNPGDRVAFIEVERGYLIVPRNRPVSRLFGMLSKYAIPGTTLEDYKNAVGRGISDHVEGAKRSGDDA